MPGNIVCAWLGTGDDLDRMGNTEDTTVGDDGLVVGTGVPGRLERERVAIHHFHRQTDPCHVLASALTT